MPQKSISESAIVGLDVYDVPVSPKTTWLFVRLRFADGIEGWGEATRFGEEAAILAAATGARTRIVGQALPIPGGILSRLMGGPASTAAQAVVHAVEQALIDAAARRAGTPLSQSLGGPFRATVACYANINRGTLDRTPQGFAAKAKTTVLDRGYAAIKIAPFDGLHWSQTNAAEGRRALRAGIDRILAVRAAVGPVPLLMVDCHWRLTPVMARDVLASCANANLFWLEDALDEATFSADVIRRLRSSANERGVRIAGGERVANMAEMMALLDRDAIDVALPDMRYTGVRAGLAMLLVAAARGVEVSLHNPVGPVHDAVSLQAAFALPEFLILEGQVDESPLFDELAGAPRTLIDGARPWTASAGSGLPAGFAERVAKSARNAGAVQ